MTTTLPIRLLVAATVAALTLTGCMAGPEDELIAVPAVQHQFTPTSATANWTDAELQLRVTGELAGDTVTVNIDLDRASVEALPQHSMLTISGETFFESANWAVFDNSETQSPVVLRAWLFGTCDACGVAQDFQRLEGGLSLVSADQTAVAGALALTMDGRVPAWNNSEGDVRAIIEVPFNISLVEPVQPTTPEEPAVEPSEPTTPPTPPSQPETEPVVEQPPAPVVDGNTISGEVTLTAEMGINFATGQAVKPANFANCDLFASAGTSFLKLSPGGPTPVKGQPLTWFTTPGGLIETFLSLSDVPNVVPQDSDGSKSIVNAKKGIGFVLRNNTSDGYTRVWIRHGAKKQVTIEYVTVLP